MCIIYKPAGGICIVCIENLTYGMCLVKDHAKWRLAW